MVASNADPGKKTAEVAQAQFEKLGFKIKFRAVPQDTLYTKFCNVPAQKIAICPNVGWFKDFNDPQAVLDAVFNGKNILPAEQLQLDAAQRPGHQRRDGKAALLPAGPERNKAWGNIDDMVTAQAPGIPYLWDKIPTVEASDVRGVVNQYSTSWDLDFTSLEVAPERAERVHCRPGPVANPSTARRGPELPWQDGRAWSPSCSPWRPRAAGASPTSSAAFRASGCRSRSCCAWSRVPASSACWRSSLATGRAVPGHAGGDPLDGGRDRRRHRAGLLLPGAGHRDDEHRGADQRHRGHAPGRGRGSRPATGCRPSSPSGWP